MAYDENTKVKELLKDDRAVAIIEKHYPGITRHPLLGMASGFTLKRISEMRSTGLTREKYETILAELRAL